MNLVLALLLLAAAYLLYDAGMVFFALVLVVVTLIMALAAAFSPRKSEAGGATAVPQPAAEAEPEPGPYAVKGHAAWEKVFMALGAVFNAVGRTVYRFVRLGKKPWE